MNALLTDLYELTMAAGYFEAGKTAERAIFELSIRRLPPHRNFVLAAGLPQAVDYLLNLSLHRRGNRLPPRALPQFQRVSPGLFRLPARFPLHRRPVSPSPKARRCSPASPC